MTEGRGACRRAGFRRCVLTRRVAPKQRMVRSVVGPGRRLLPDFDERLPGRGIWLSVEGDVLEAAGEAGRLARAVARAAGGAVVIPAGFLCGIASGLEARIATLLLRADRAGQAAVGREAVQSWLAEGRLGLWLRAEEALGAAVGPADGVGQPAGGVAFLRVPGAALGRAFGAEGILDVGLRPGRQAEMVRSAAERLMAVGARRDGRVHDGRQ